MTTNVSMAALDLLIPKPAPPGMTGRWATVTQADPSPLRIRYDGEADPLPVPVVDLVGGLEVGDRVRCWLDNAQVYVVGRLGGRAVPDPYVPPVDVLSTSYGTLSDAGTHGGTTVGGYEKKANGRLTCWIRCRIVPVANNYTTRAWTFPVEFAAVPAVVASPDTTATTVQLTSASGPSTSACNLGIVRTNTTGTYLHAVAEGFWDEP